MSEPTLLPGAEHFRVEEIPAYQPSGSGEHLYVRIEKTGLNTDMVAERLAKACARPRRDVGYAGRKDRHAVTTQWFSIRLGDEARLASLDREYQHGSLRVLDVTRHGNKLRPGHLKGNRFDLGIGCLAKDGPVLRDRLAVIARDGMLNTYGPQRFGINGATLTTARQLARGHTTGAVETIIDCHGNWHWGDELPDGFRPGAEGRVLGALRRGADPERALRAAGKGLHQLYASAAQSAVFNAVAAARRDAGLLFTLRPGDIAQVPSGAHFLVDPDASDDATARARAGNCAVVCTGPLPGSKGMRPSPAIEAEEQAWSAHLDLPWSAFDRHGHLASHGDRRAIVTPCLEAPQLVADQGHQRCRFALPAGSFATELLKQCGIAIPEQRRGSDETPS